MMKYISIALIPFSLFLAKILFNGYGYLFGNMASDKNIVLVSFNVSCLIAAVLFCYYQNMKKDKVDL